MSYISDLYSKGSYLPSPKAHSQVFLKKSLVFFLSGIINSMDMSLSKFQETVKDREVWYAVVHGVSKESDTTKQLNNKCIDGCTIRGINSENQRQVIQPVIDVRPPLLALRSSVQPLSGTTMPGSHWESEQQKWLSLL